MLLIDAAGLMTAIDLLLWPMRRHWAGPLLVDLSARRTAGARFFLGMMIFFMISYLVTFLSMPSSARLVPLFYFVGLVPYTMSVYGHWNRFEIRERGLVTRRGLLRWGRIESYGWERPGGAFALLKLRVHSSLPPFAAGFTCQLTDRSKQRQSSRSN